MSEPTVSMSDDKKYRIRAAAFLGLVGGISALFGFSRTLGKSKKSESKLIEKGGTKALILLDEGSALAMRAFGWGSLYALLGTGTFCFGIWKLSGANNVKPETADLRSQMIDLQKRIDEIDAQSQQNDVAGNIAEPENSGDEGDNNNQLYGKDYKDEAMVLLKDEIYCRKRIFEMAKGCSFKPSHVARRLLEGVYKKEAILKSTLTGQPPKSQGRERQMGQYECLDPRAKSAIVEFSIERGIKKGWIVQNEYEINRALSQKIGELKRLYNRQAV